MKIGILRLFLAAGALLAAAPSSYGQIVVAHRGASGYLPEHTFAAKVLAYQMGADFLEQDVCLSKDNVPVVIHDIYLDSTSDVATKFPDRHRADGHYYVADFTMDEIRTLTAHERVDTKTGQPVFGRRFGLGGPRFEIHTLDEELALIQRLNRETGKNVGAYVEIKRPEFHMNEGRDITKIVYETLEKFGYNSRDSQCWIQCFDATALKRLRSEFHCKLKLTQLMSSDNGEAGAGNDFAQMLTPEGLAGVAEYADAIGPSILQLANLNADGKPVSSGVTEAAHEAGLQVCPYTLRRDSLPHGINEEMALNVLFNMLHVDGLFSDFPDSVHQFLNNR